MIFIQSSAFERRLTELAREPDELLRRIESDLQADPERGDIVPGLAGIRKARIGDSDSARGKRGGLRYLYLYVRTRSDIYLLFLYAKNEQLDLTNAQRREMKAMAEALKRGE